MATKKTVKKVTDKETFYMAIGYDIYDECWKSEIGNKEHVVSDLYNNMGSRNYDETDFDQSTLRIIPFSVPKRTFGSGEKVKVVATVNIS